MNKALACHCEPKAEPGHEIGTVLALDFKKKDGDSFMDRSVYGHLCTNHGSKWQLDGRYFDGVDDYVDLPDNFPNVTDFTFVAWIYWLGGSNWQRIFDFGENTTHYMFLAPKTDVDTLRLEIQKEGLAIQRIDTAKLTVNRRHNAAVTLEADTGKLYVDGNPKKTGTITLNPSDVVGVNAWLGRSQFTTDPYYNGLIGEVLTYNFADYAPRILSRSIGG